MNIIIRNKKPEALKQIEDNAKKVIRDCYKQECRQEEHALRRIGQGTFTKDQIKKIWESDKLNHKVLSNIPKSGDSGVYE